VPAVTTTVSPGHGLILAAGLGTRLLPLTRGRAKPAVPVAGRSLIDRIAGWLARHGVTELLVNLHYRAETITAEVGDGRRLGVRVRYSWEHPVLGSGGGPRRAFALTPYDRLWLINGDTLTDVDLQALWAEHQRSGALVTMAVVPNPDPLRYGGVLVEEDGSVTGFTRRGMTQPSWHFVGVQVAERSAYASLQDGIPAESIGALYPRLMRELPGSVRAFRSEAPFHDIGTPDDYLMTCLALAPGPEALRSSRARVSGGAAVIESVLWDDVTVGERARLYRCVVADGVRVPAALAVAHAVITPDGPEPLLPGECRQDGIRILPGLRGAPSA